jgi:hypothetical protein
MNHIDKNIVRELARDLIDELKEDLINHGWIQQAVRLRVGKDASISLYVQSVLDEMLNSGEVEIGETRKECRQGRPYLAFIAWRGTIEERIARAMNEVERWSKPEIDPVWSYFAYWVCLRKNIDGYEGEGTIVGVDEPKID